MNRHLPSFHDHLIVGYEVDCEAREIKLRIKPPAWDAAQADVTTVVFAGVQGYHFECDAFGNIVLDLESVPMQWFVSQNRSELDEFHRFGALAVRPADPDAAPGILSDQGLHAFVLSASLGLTGWVLAKEAYVRRDANRSDEQR